MQEEPDKHRSLKTRDNHHDCGLGARKTIKGGGEPPGLSYQQKTLLPKEEPLVPHCTGNYRQKEPSEHQAKNEVSLLD